MRRSPALLFSLSAAVLLTVGCSSSNTPHAARSSSASVSLAGGDNLGRMLHRDSPSLAIVSSTPSSNLATAPTDADIR